MAMAERLDQRAGGVEAQHLVRVAIGHQHGAVGRGADVVRLGQPALAPRSGEPSVALEDEDRPIGAALRDMHPPRAVDHQVRDEAKAFARGQPRPFAMDRVAAVAEQHDVRFIGHARSSTH